MIALVLATAISCGGGDGPKRPNNNGGGGGGGGGGVGGGGGSTSSSITVVDNSFDPAGTTVAVNTTVTWTFSSSNTQQHNVTFSNASLGTSGNRSAGAVYTKQFTAAGVFNYQCTIHGASMSGSVTVQ